MNLFQTTTASLVLGAAVLTGGCQYDRSDAIPKTAIVAVEGDNMLNWRASQDGIVYLQDHRAGEVLFSADIARGQAIVVDTVKNQVTLDNRIVSEGRLRRGNTHRIYFSPTTTGNMGSSTY